MKANDKFQIPNPKFQTNPKTQAPINENLRAGWSSGIWDLRVGILLGFGIWDLEFLLELGGFQRHGSIH
jgi:hypothetical protein